MNAPTLHALLARAAAGFTVTADDLAGLPTACRSAVFDAIAARNARRAEAAREAREVAARNRADAAALDAFVSALLALPFGTASAPCPGGERLAALGWLASAGPDLWSLTPAGRSAGGGRATYLPCT